MQNHGLIKPSFFTPEQHSFLQVWDYGLIIHLWNRALFNLYWSPLTKPWWCTPMWVISSFRAASGFAPSQWEMTLLCIDISHWLGASTEWALSLFVLCVEISPSDQAVMCSYHAFLLLTNSTSQEKNNSLIPGRCGSNFKSVFVKLIIQNSSWGICCEITLGWLPQNLINEKSTLFPVMAWCHQATNHYLNQCRQRSILPYDH